jgi:hypothetical protein
MCTHQGDFMMSKAKIAVLMSVLLVVVLTASAFAELVVTYTSSDDSWSEYTINDSETRKAGARSIGSVDFLAGH